MNLLVNPDNKPIIIMLWIIIFNTVSSLGVGECNVRSKTGEFMKTIARTHELWKGLDGEQKM